ncbi:hypothetical protein ACFOYW_15355 [Gryllotalpicola reticulitermitis]|uniref:NADH-quinone oxidoreductase subunit J n=1 Tax=Gryllotalpicola reticulitermitis TaxID=1184153 RepID=A0ABV8Q8Y8_9MICO
MSAEAFAAELVHVFEVGFETAATIALIGIVLILGGGALVEAHEAQR